MARLGGMSSESFSSPSRGLGSLLRDQKLRTSSIFGMGTRMPTFSVSAMASSPKEPGAAPASLLEGDISAEESDEFKEDDVWAMTDSRSYQDLDEGLGFDTQKADDDLGVGLGFGLRSHRRNNRIGSGTGELGNGTSSKIEQVKKIEVVMASSRKTEKSSGLADSFVKNHQGFFPLTAVSESSSASLVGHGHPHARSPGFRSAAASSRTMMIPRRAFSDNDSLTAWHIERQSAPVEVPDWSKIMETRGKKMDSAPEKDEDEEERLPPHELLAREYARSQRTTFSVCEGLGRTLKGRDMSRVRNAVWSQMGFAD